MQPLDDQLSRLLKSAAEQPRPNSTLPQLSAAREDEVIRAWRHAIARPAPGWFDGLLGPSVALAGAAMALALALNYQSLSEGGATLPQVEFERLIADSSTQLALLP